MSSDREELSAEYLLVLDRRWNDYRLCGGMFLGHIYAMCLLMRKHYLDLHKAKGGRDIELFDCEDPESAIFVKNLQDKKLGDKPLFISAELYGHASAFTNLWHPKYRTMVYLDSLISAKELEEMKPHKQPHFSKSSELRNFLKFAEMTDEETVPIVITEYQGDTRNCGLYFLAFMDQAYRIALGLNKDNENASNLTIPDHLYFRRVVYKMLTEKRFIPMKDNIYFYKGDKEPVIVRRIRRSERLAK